MKKFWHKLKPWQKGAIAGGIFIIIDAILFLIFGQLQIREPYSVDSQLYHAIFAVLFLSLGLFMLPLIPAALVINPLIEKVSQSSLINLLVYTLASILFWGLIGAFIGWLFGGIKERRSLRTK